MLCLTISCPYEYKITVFRRAVQMSVLGFNKFYLLIPPLILFYAAYLTSMILNVSYWFEYDFCALCIVKAFRRAER